jgi:hypothetical protein
MPLAIPKAHRFSSGVSAAAWLEFGISESRASSPESLFVRRLYAPNTSCK